MTISHDRDFHAAAIYLHDPVFLGIVPGVRRHQLPQSTSGPASGAQQRGKRLFEKIRDWRKPALDCHGCRATHGYTPNVWYYFRPQDGNPFVIAWLATVFAASYFYAWWVLFAGGAEKVRDLNLSLMLGHYAGKRQPLWAIKLFAAIGVAMFPVWVYVAMSMDAPLPKF